MGGIFGYDTLIGRISSKLVKCFFLSLLWILFCIPIVTIGAATSALYYTVHKVIRKDRSTMWKSFWSSFKSNFKQSTIVWMIQIIVVIFLAVDCYLFYMLYAAGEIPVFILLLVYIIMMLVFIWLLYLQPYIARFQNTYKGIFVNCGHMVLQNMLWSLELLLVFVISIIGIFFVPILVMFIPAGAMFIAGRPLEIVFEKYMTEEDILAEAERNQQYIDEKEEK